MVAGLSSSVTSAVVAVLGAGVVITTYVSDKYTHLFWFYVVMAFAAAALVRSLLVGGSGVYEIAEDGFEGNWKTKTDKRRFNKQVSWMMTGIALLLVASVVGLSATRRESDSASTQAIRNLTKEVDGLQAQLERLSKAQARARKAERRLTRRVRRLERRGHR